MRQEDRSRWLVLEGKGHRAAWAVARGLPAHPGDSRAATRLPEDALPDPATPWDEGVFRATGAKRGEVVLALEGARIRGRYAFHRDARDAPDVWTLARVDPATLRPEPESVLPMLARAAEYPGDEAGYAFEIKWDGIRAIAHHRADGSLRLRSRNLIDITNDHPELGELKEILAGRDVTLDGEIVAFDDRGLPGFQALQARREGARVFVAFDVPHLDGHDVTKRPYEERRALLESLDLATAHVQTTPSYVGEGRALLATPGLELFGFVDARDASMLATIDRTLEQLTADGLVYRYVNVEDDGVGGPEATFAYCTFWLVEALANAGRAHDARAVFDRLVERATPLGLYAEEIDAATGAHLGNFPQGFPHAGLIQAARALAAAEQALQLDPE